MIGTAVMDFLVGKVLGTLLKGVLWPWRKLGHRQQPAATPPPMFDIGDLGEGDLTGNRSERGGILRARRVRRLRARDNVSGSPPPGGADG